MEHKNRFCFIACLLLFVVALARYWVFDQTEPVPHDPESFRVARSIAEKGEFSNPFVPLDTGPSAHLAPAFPAFLALLIRTFGDGATGMYAIKVAAAITLSVLLALFPVFSRALGMGQLNGIIASSIWIAAKVGTAGGHGHQEVAMFGWESFYGAILVAIALCLFRRYLDNSSRTLAWCLGCVMGVLTLTAFTAAIIAIGLFGLLLWREKLAIFKKRGLLLFLLLPAMIVAPWTIRNALVFHRFIPVRDNLGLELAVSNNDCAMFGLYQNFDCFFEVHPNGSIAEASKVLSLGEPAYNDLKLREALTWIQTHPARFLELCALRFAAFWIPPANEGPYSLLGLGHRTERVAIYMMTLLSFGGLFFLYQRDRLSASICLACLVLYPLIYYVIQYEYRYRYPILWVTFLLGSFPLTVFVQRIYSRLRPQSERIPWTASAATEVEDTICQERRASEQEKSRK
jgi:hypothetical protein